MALIRFIYGPRTGEQQHCSRECADALVTGGFAELVEKPNPDAAIEQARKVPPAGWIIAQVGHIKQRFALVRNDGFGGSAIYEDAPKHRVWHYDPASGREGYVEQATDCPPELIERFRALKAANDATLNADHFALGELQRQERVRLQQVLDAQDAAAATLVRTFGGNSD